jgi:sigma-E factor negative regulatory protein RseB
MLVAGSAPPVLAQQADSVKSWLDRMNAAVEELNYRGAFVHIIDGNAEELNIVHRYSDADGEVRERISAAGDNGREIIRTGDFVSTVVPEKRRVVVEEVKNSSIPTAAALNYSEDLQTYYDMHTAPKGPIAGHEAQLISIQPRDNFRYGYRVWLDRETALPLKSQVMDDNGEVVEQMLFTALEVVDSVPESEVLPAIGTDGFEWLRPIEARPDIESDEIWGATRLPNGFALSLSRHSLLAGSKYPVQHLVYTDGLATVSVFIAHPDSDADMPEGLTRFGSTNVYSLKINGRLATVMGEVPPRTVERIANSLDAR